MVVKLLMTNDIAAHVEEDQSGVSLWAFGTLSQFHQPNVWVDKSTAESAAQIIHQFEVNKRERENPGSGTSEIAVVCDECGKTTLFPNTLDGTTQDCSHCDAYVDVGELPWTDNFDVTETETP